jgi:hypothetical protein
MFYTFRYFSREIAKAKQANKTAPAYWRFFRRWRKYLSNHNDSLKNELPWLTFPVIDFLNDWLRKEHRVLEYGGGSSSIFFARRTREVVTVEHHAGWFANISNVISNKGLSNWKGLLFPAEEGMPYGNDIAEPLHYVSGDPESSGKNYHAYACAIDQYEDSYFDLVLVDGRARPSCMLHSIPKIRKGGLLILDNSDRAYYLTSLKELINKEFDVVIDCIAPSVYSHEFTSTTVWRKKS